MKSDEYATNIVIALINNNRVNTVEQAAEAYKKIYQAIIDPSI